MLMPTFRRLQVFVAVAETGSFAAAARRLGIAQPSVSAHIRSLEHEAGASLFERASGRAAALTSTGQTFLAHARDLVADATRLEQKLATARGETRHSLVVNCQRTLADPLFRGLLAAFARSNREIRLAVRTTYQEEVLASVRSGEADVGVLVGASPVQGLPCRLIGRQRCVVYAAPDHPLAGRERVPPAAVAACDFVGAPARSQFGRTMTQLLARIGVTPLRFSAEATDFGMSRDFAAAGLGLCCSLETALRDDLASGRVVAIDVNAPPLYVDVYQVTSPLRVAAWPVERFATWLDAAGAQWP
jgi:LysR family transcriptional regulator, low CO2-responsive transcriptional regulator